MVIVRLHGGIGNQMFQYAMARRVAVKNNTVLKLDLSGIKKGITPRCYELDVFNIKAGVASQQEIVRLKNSLAHYPLLASLYKKMVPSYQKQYIKEKSFHFDPEVLKASGEIYIQGYWQSEKYFEDIKDIIRDDFLFKIVPDSANQMIINEITNKTAVSVHIRRGDYAINPAVNKIISPCPLEYYYRAIENLSESVLNFSLFIFSDDPVWVKENFRSDFPYRIVSHNPPDKGFEDLRLMSLCKHHIIANSTFSWWGAWLSNHPDKIVISPQKWCNVGRNAADKIPQSWIQI